MSTSAALHEHITIHIRRGAIILTVRLCQRIGIQYPMRYYLCKTRQHRHGTSVGLRVTTAGALNGHSETCAIPKSYQGESKFKAPSARGGKAESSRQ